MRKTLFEVLIAVLATLIAVSASAEERPQLPPRTPEFLESPKMLEAIRVLCNLEPNMKWNAVLRRCFKIHPSEQADLRVIYKYIHEDDEERTKELLKRVPPAGR